ncbi:MULTISPECIES: hypothetical protein [unclassified Streptomyces]|uniref:hypothetical protein n=1 Tax=unclassified Streptomyces TaxID=2593676 RepID=UPI000AD0AEE1|nr:MULTISPECIES: hypothetical protein [unclassified Streptomyces]MCX5152326.1 IS110 family transposase [Streptomyces sp. NBC_00320]WSN46677.1 hypothetical protein OG299_02655 [Streptomyces sp. NBC_01296]
MGRKTDAKDACVIADQAQMRRNLQPCLDVVWALVRDQRTLDAQPPQRGLALG